MNTFLITAKDIGLRLDKFLLRNSKLPWSLINRLSRQGQFRISGLRIPSSYRFKANDSLELPASFKLTKPLLTPSGLVEDFKQWIIFQNDDLIVINKPPGISAQGGTAIKISIDAIAQEYCSAKLVHRIDKNVSGLMILAKHTRACQVKIENKRYFALVEGKPQAEGKILDRIATDKDRQVVSNEGKEAQTTFKVVKSVMHNGSWYSLLDILITTGRKHQIRVHCAQSLNCPVLGDEKYGSEGKSRIYLHAYSCDADNQKFVAPIGKDFIDMLISLGFSS